MNKLMKRLVSGALSLALVASLSVSAFAADLGSDKVTARGDTVASAEGTESEGIYTYNGGDIPVTLYGNYANSAPNFSLTYAWDATLEWTYLNNGTTGVWVVGDQKAMKDDEVRRTITGRSEAAAAIASEASAVSEDEIKAHYMLKTQSRYFTITNNSTAYELKYNMTGSDSSNLKFGKGGTEASSTGFTNVKTAATAVDNNDSALGKNASAYVAVYADGDLAGVNGKTNDGATVTAQRIVLTFTRGNEI